MGKAPEQIIDDPARWILAQLHLSLYDSFSAALPRGHRQPRVDNGDEPTTPTSDMSDSTTVGVSLPLNNNSYSTPRFHLRRGEGARGMGGGLFYLMKSFCIERLCNFFICATELIYGTPIPSF